jgi:hypothetical protein
MIATDLFGTEAPGGVIPANTSHFFCDGVWGLERRFRIGDSKPVTTVAAVHRGR